MATLDLRTEIREFLRSRRARLSPTQAGLPAYGGKRRVQGSPNGDARPRPAFAPSSSRYSMRSPTHQPGSATAATTSSR